MSEKIGGAKGTELDEEFVEMERVSCFTGLSAYILTYTFVLCYTTYLPPKF